MRQTARRTGHPIVSFLGVVMLVAMLSIGNGLAHAAPLEIMTENYPPYNYEEDGEVTGLSTEIVREILHRIGHPDTITVLPWARAYAYIQRKTGQVLFSMSRTEPREELFKWAGPLAEYRVVFFAKTGSGIEMNSLDDARKVEAIGSGFKTSGTIFLKEQGFTNVDTVSDPKLNAKKLVLGRIDLWLSGELSGIHRARQAGVDPAMLETVHTLRKEHLYIAFSQDVPDATIALWQRTLHEIKADGTYDRILSKYLGTEGTSEPPSRTEPLKLVTGNEYPPFTDENLPNGGMITEIVQTVFDHLGYAADITFAPWRRGYDETNAGRYAATFPYVKDQKRMQDFLYSDPIYTITDRFFVRQDFPRKFRTDEDLQGLTACKPLGYSLDEIKHLLAQDIITLTRATQMTNCFRMLARGRVDLLPINEHVGWSMIQELYGPEGRQKFHVLEKLLKEHGLYLIISKTFPNGEVLMQTFNKGLQHLREDGTLDDIISRHLTAQ